MKKVLYVLIVVFAAVGVASAQSEAPVENVPVRVAADPAKGFAYPYYLYIPKEVRDAASAKEHTILVLPNNSGKSSDDLNFQEEDVKTQLKKNIVFADRLGVVLIEPVFPRPAADWQIYTHALDRDSMLTDKKEYKRFDLQLIAMIDDARERLSEEKLKAEKRVLMFGFSASGMFVNRFAFLHPTRVKAAVVGSPGGWPIAPAAAYKGKALRYPIGISDIMAVSGKDLDTKNLRKVPLFMLLGNKDENDSVIYRDSYEKEDEELIFELFGKTPVERWEVSEKLYNENKLNAEFHLYPDVGHTLNKDMVNDIFAFLKKYTR
jgi:pimeloyl-ACP methyl ester carboxylesterase